MFSLDPSDVVLILDLIAAFVVALYFAVGRPRVWHKDRLGWVIFGYAVATVALLVLIVYGIVFGQKVHEVARFLVAAGLLAALVSKGHSMYRERRAGRMANKRPDSKLRSLMMHANSSAPVTTDENGEPTLKPQPKVAAGAITAGVLVVIVAILAAVTPDMLSGLGSWGVLLFAGITALGQFLGAYMKRPTGMGD